MTGGRPSATSRRGTGDSVARWILTHQEGGPRQVLKGRIPGCQWAGVSENGLGGMSLRLVVDP